MKSLRIISDKHASLRRKSVEVKFPIEQHIIDLANNMRNYLINSQDPEYLKKHPRTRSGVGLAAPQVGKNIRMFAVAFVDDESVYDFVLINPVITKVSKTPSFLAGGEGCLSVNEEHKGYVIRNSAITIEGFDLNTKKMVSVDLEGYPAIVFQHEYDHLDGVLFYDRISKHDPFKEIEGAIVIE